MKEDEIRPQRIFDEYLRLAEADAVRYFGDVERTPVPCPACGGQGQFAFVKKGFAYVECPSCQTLYVSPRPAPEVFSRYYQESESAKYWASTFYKETAEARREKLWKPKAQQVYEMLASDGARPTVIDIGGGYGIFAEEYARVSGDAVVVIEPGPALADVCRGKGLQVVPKFLEDIDAADLPRGPKAFLSFELFEHLHDPRQFCGHLFALMAPGDRFIFTTLSGAGADILALWEHSKSVSPPHHLNFLNPKSVARLLGDLGYEVRAVTTPGKLDVDILANNAAAIKDRFWRTFVAQSNRAERAAMQTFLAANGLSSHMMIDAVKP